MNLVQCVALVSFLIFSMIHGFNADEEYIPADNYLIAYGSLQNVSVQGRIFVPDSKQELFVLRTQGNSVIASSSPSVPSPIFNATRIFPTTATYKFKIQQQGRHWARLYFYPLPNSNHKLDSAPITVVTNDFVLLHNFTFKNYNGSFLFKEYSINITSDTFTLNFIPSNNSVIFVNGLEVVSVPDELIPDQAVDLSPQGRTLLGMVNLNEGL